jgi:hypothetical protein
LPDGRHGHHPGGSGCSDETWDYPSLGGVISIPLISPDKRENFLLDIRKGRIDLSKGSYQNRVLLAPTSGLSSCNYSRQPPGILASQVPENCGSGSEKSRRTQISRMECDRCLGVRDEGLEKAGHATFKAYRLLFIKFADAALIHGKSRRKAGRLSSASAAITPSGQAKHLRNVEKPVGQELIQVQQDQ